MTRVRIYTKQGCHYSNDALFFLDEKGIPYEEVDITDDPQRRAEMIEAANGADTTPQIFIDGQHVGGYEELVDEDRQGHLAAIMASGLEQPATP
jgi:glutaredoxin 3